MFVGLDFGTSNTSAALYTGKEIRYIPLDPFNPEDPNVLSSMLYITKEGERFYGAQAIAAYLDRMIGRSITYERKDVGDLEMTFADMTYVTQAFYMEEKEIPGRLFQYLKKYVGSNFKTNVFGTFYKPYELIARILKHIKEATEAHVQQEIDGVVLGRPVKFSDEEGKNRDAVTNLRTACHLAGFKHVEFQYEPVAAAFNYALTATTPEHILIFDFGGGTFDVTIVNAQAQKSTILGLGGVPVGGSDFDKAIMYEKIAPYFGKGATVKDHWVPDNTFLELLNWQTIMHLNRDRRFLKSLDNWLYYADDPAPFKALHRLVKEDHGFAIFREIENAKKLLSSVSESTVKYFVPEVFQGEGAIEIEQVIARQEFEALLHTYSRQIFDAIDEALKSANLTYQDIHRVIRVGGSSKIPFFHALLAQKFGQEKLFMHDEFKNVSAGLAVEAFHQA